MQIASSAGDTSAHELAIVLEVEGEQRFLAAHLADEAVEAFALVGLHQMCIRDSLLPDEAKFWAHFKATAADMFGRYG